MNQRMKKYILLFFAILIPLLIAFLIASYGYNSDKFGQGAWKNQYREEFLAFPEDATTAEQIEKHLQYGINNQYYLYEEDPVYSNLVQKDDKNLFRLEIFRTIYKTNVKNEDGETVEENRVQYLFLIYDVQYQNIRNLFTEDTSSELYKAINSANVPTFTIKLTEILENDTDDDEIEPQTKSATMSEISRILDKGSDFDTVKGEVLDEDETTTNKLLTVVLGTVKMDDTDWSPKSKVEITASVSGVTDVDGNNVTEELTTLELDLSAEAGDVSGLAESYQQDLDRTGFFAWVFKKYLWWISLIALFATGLITLSFYAVYLAEEQEAARNKRKIRIKR